MLFIEKYLCSKSIKKCRGIVNTEFKIVFIPRERDRQKGRTLGK